MTQLSEAEIKEIAEKVLQKLGDSASKKNIESVVKETISRIENKEEIKPKITPKISKKATDRVIVTAFGQNKKGILAGLTGTIASLDCDIIDLSQKILQEFFTIMLLIDSSGSEYDFETVKSRLIETGEKYDLKVIVQHEDIFKQMHRV